MVKSSAANVVDLETFRQRKLRDERSSEVMMPMASGAQPQPHAVVVPVWFCWVPVWAPMFG